jgi:hypothetical protein
MYPKFWSEDPKEINHSEDLRIDRRIILELILGKWGGKFRTECIWFGIGSSGWIL